MKTKVKIKLATLDCCACTLKEVLYTLQTNLAWHQKEETPGYTVFCYEGDGLVAVHIHMYLSMENNVNN